MSARKNLPRPVGGKCCACGYTGEEETPCPKRPGDSHCDHWWDGPDAPPGEPDHAPDTKAAKET